MNNYETWRKDWRKKILDLDVQTLLRKLPFLKLENNALVYRYFHQACRFRLSDGVIESALDLSLYDDLNFMTMLWYAKEGAALTGQWLPFVQLKNASPFGSAFQKGNLSPMAATFSGHMDKLEQALIAFGGRRLPTGDVGYEIDVFACIPVRVLFWEGDDEFPAQTNLLFDSSATDFNHVESIVTIASAVLRHLAKEAGLPVKDGAF